MLNGSTYAAEDPALPLTIVSIATSAMPSTVHMKAGDVVTLVEAYRSSLDAYRSSTVSAAVADLQWYVRSFFFCGFFVALLLRCGSVFTMLTVTRRNCAIDIVCRAMDHTTSLAPLHMAAWAALWQSGYEITGRDDVAVAVNASLYAMLSAVRDDFDFSLSPGGLTNGGWQGGVRALLCPDAGLGGLLLLLAKVVTTRLCCCAGRYAWDG